MSAHFRPAEFRCRHCGVVRVVPELLEHLEQLRAAVGRPIAIRSGYRCPVHNLDVGGAPRSQHLLGKAADIAPGIATVLDARRAGFTGIGSSGRWAVHVDVRDGPRTEWVY